MGRRKPDSQLVALPANNPMATREETVEKADKAYDLRLQGLTYKQVGKETGVSEATALRRCNLVTAMRWKGVIAKDDNLKVEINDRLDMLMSRWFPIAMSEKLNVSETKTGKNGHAYDIQLPAWEASTQAFKNCMEIIDKKMKVNGIAKSEGGGKFTTEETGEVVISMFNAMHKLAGGDLPKAIEAKLVEKDD